MEDKNYHSTQNLYIERSSAGIRVKVKDVKNTLNKNNEFCAVIFTNPDSDIKDGDVYRLFFKLLDEGSLKSKQGAILKCDKKNMYYMDDTYAFPIGVSYDHLDKDKVYLKVKSYKYKNGLTKAATPFYRNLSIDRKYFTDSEKNPSALAKHFKKNISNIITTDGYKVVEFDVGCFEKVPVVNVKHGFTYPTGIKIKSVDSEKNSVKALIDVNDTQMFVDIVFSSNDVPNFLCKQLYSFYVARMILKGNVVVNGNPIRYNSIEEKYVYEDPQEIAEEPKKEETSEIIFDPTSKEAKALIGKRVFYSLGIKYIEGNIGILDHIDESSNFPFKITAPDNHMDCIDAVFIRKAPDLEVKCYDFSKYDIITKLYGKIFKTKDQVDVEEEMVIGFKKVDDRWLLNGKHTSFKFKNDFTWIDGSPCGEEIEEIANNGSN